MLDETAPGNLAQLHEQDIVGVWRGSQRKTAAAAVRQQKIDILTRQEIEELGLGRLQLQLPHIMCQLRACVDAGRQVAGA